MPTENNQVLAKSNGVSLLDHSILTGMFAETIARKKYITDDENLFSEIRISGFLHDIAKEIDKNQKLIKNNKKLHQNPSHNEEGWAFLSKHFQCKSSLSKNNILYSVYWHHGIPYNNKRQSNVVIYDTIKQKDIQNLINFTKEVLKGYDQFSCSDEPSENTIFPPKFYQEKDDFETSLEFFSRACLISADRIVSGFDQEMIDYFLSNNERIEKHIDDLMLIHHCDEINFIHFDNERFEIQKSLVQEESKTICFNGPAGFGKTNAGLFWITKNKEKTIWVCPRNTVAHSVYHSIIETFKQFDIKNISVELYLTGKVQKTNNPNNNQEEGFLSDIIVTNIDNFLAPSIDNGNANRLFYTVNSNVIFDEYHEYVSKGDGENKNILFSCFVNMLKTRHRNTKSRTLLISGTPIYEIENLWDYDSDKTKYLPEKYKHYPSAHDKHYSLFVEDNIPNIEDNKNAIMFLNAVFSTQQYKIEHLSIEIFHGNFEKWYKDRKLENMFLTNGKNSIVSESKQNVVSTHALQASADLSFCSLYESVVSPMATLQRIGRTNRWGEFETAEIHVFDFKTNSELSAKKSLYDLELCEKWFKVLVKNDGKKLNLSQIYELYNKFCEDNKIEIKKYINKCHSDSFNLLKDFYPTQSIPKEEKETENKRKNANSNIIRSSGNQIFCIYKIKNSDLFTEPFNEIVYGKNFKKSFHEPEDKRLLNRIKKAMKGIIRGKQNGLYDYSKLVDSGYIDKIRKAAQYSDTPYIVFNKEYDPILGVIKIK